MSALGPVGTMLLRFALGIPATVGGVPGTGIRRFVLTAAAGLLTLVVRILFLGVAASAGGWLLGLIVVIRRGRAATLGDRVRIILLVVFFIMTVNLRLC